MGLQLVRNHILLSLFMALFCGQADWDVLCLLSQVLESVRYTLWIGFQGKAWDQEIESCLGCSDSMQKNMESPFWLG